MKTLLLALFFSSILLIGCAASYTTSDFQEVKLFDNLFKISYNGNSGFNDEKGTDFALLRSAEVAKKNGFTFFATIIDDNYSDTSKNTKALLEVGNSYRTANPSISKTILCFKGIQVGPLYDVDVIISSMRKKYNITN